MKVFRQTYQPPMSSSSRGRSLTPPSMKYLRPSHEMISSIPPSSSSSRYFNDPYTAQRLPSSAFNRSRRDERRSRSRSRKEKKRKRSSSSSSAEEEEEERVRGPRTPPSTRKRFDEENSMNGQSHCILSLSDLHRIPIELVRHPKKTKRNNQHQHGKCLRSNFNDLFFFCFVSFADDRLKRPIQHENIRKERVENDRPMDLQRASSFLLLISSNLYLFCFPIRYCNCCYCM